MPPCFIIVCQNTAISKLVYDFISGFHRKNEDGTTTLENGRLALFRNFDETTGNPLPRPNTLLIDSEQLEAGDALDDNFRGMAADEIERFRREIVERTGDARAGDNITDQELLREVMNTVGKPGQLGGSIRCVVSVSMLTEGWDANTVTHVLGIRAFGTQLLCEQVIGRALRRQSYELNEEGLFNVEYADVFGIPFDFTAKPVIAPPQPPRETVQVKAMRPERDALEIRFPRVEGYRVELPEERLTADFNDDSDPGTHARSRRPVDHAQLRHHRRRRRPEPRASGRHAAVHAGLPPHPAPALHEVARPRRGAEAPPVRPAQAHHQAVARHLPRLQGRHLSGAAHVSGTGRHGLQPHHRGHHPRSSSASARSRRCSIPTTPPARPRTSASTRRAPTAGTRAARRRRTTSTGSCSTATGRPSSAAWPRRIPRCVAYTKNHNLGLEVPYRYGSETRKYLPDFIVLVDDGHGPDDLLHLVVEIKGYRREDAKEKKSTMDTYWVPGVNHLGSYGRWAFAEFTEVYQIESDFKAKVESEFDKMIAQVAGK